MKFKAWTLKNGCLATKRALDHKPKLCDELMMGLWKCKISLGDQCFVWLCEQDKQL